MHIEHRIRPLYLWLLGLFALAGMARWVVHIPSPQQSHDLRVPWTGARLLSKGLNPLDGQAMQREWRQSVDFDSMRLVPGSAEMPAIYPPPAYTLYLPLGILPFESAWILNLLLIIASAAVVVWLTQRILAHYGHAVPIVAIALLMLALKGSSNAFAVGQPTFLALALSLGAWYAALKNRNIMSGCLVGLALFKFTVVLPVVVWMLWHRKYSALAGAAAVCVLLTLPVHLVAGWNWPLQYLDTAAAWRFFCFDTTRPGFPLVYELSALTEFRVLAALHPAIPAWLPSVLILPALVYLLWRNRHQELALYAVASLGSLLLLQHLFYDMLMLLPLGAVWLYRRPQSTTDWIIVALLLTYFIPINRLLDFAGIANAFLYMHNAWVTAALVLVLCVRERSLSRRNAV
jgi:hypothetical protein